MSDAAMTTVAEVLRLDGIRRSFHQGETRLDVLRGAELSLAGGEIVALVGPSGAGKSTLLHIAGLLEQPDGGTITIAGQRCDGLGDGPRTALRRSAIGFVYQFHHLLPEFSAIENVVLPQMIAGRSRSEARQRGGSCWPGSAWPEGWSIARPSCRAASSSASPSPGRWPTRRRC